MKQIKKIRLEGNLFAYDCDVVCKGDMKEYVRSNSTDVITGNLLLEDNSYVSSFHVLENAYIGNEVCFQEIISKEFHAEDNIIGTNIKCNNTIVMGNDALICGMCCTIEGDIVCGNNTRIEYAISGGNMSIGNFAISSDLIVKGNLVIGNNAICTKILSNSNIIVGEHANIQNLSCDGDVIIGEHCNLNKLTAKGSVFIADHFTVKEQSFTIAPIITSEGSITIGEKSYLVGYLKAQGDVNIGKNSSIDNIFSGRNVTIGDKVLTGNISAEGDVYIGKNSVTGDIRSFGNITVEPNSVTGNLEAKGRVKYL